MDSFNRFYRYDEDFRNSTKIVSRNINRLKEINDLGKSTLYILTFKYDIDENGDKRTHIIYHINTSNLKFL